MTESHSNNSIFFKEYKKKRPRVRNSRSNNPSTRISIKLSVNRWRAKNPLKLAAHTYIKNFIYRKGIRPEKCAINNESCCKAIDAHHSDYSKLHEITWLCRKHHKAWHRVFLAEGE